MKGFEKWKYPYRDIFIDDKEETLVCFYLYYPDTNLFGHGKDCFVGSLRESSPCGRCIEQQAKMMSCGVLYLYRVELLLLY